MVKGVVKNVERHVTVRHADRQRIQNSKKRIHKVRSMRGKPYSGTRNSYDNVIDNVKLREKIHDDDTP